MKLVLDEQKEYTQCYNCDAEFRVQSLFEEDSDEMEIVFCPYCGEELDGGIDEEELWEESEGE